MRAAHGGDVRDDAGRGLVVGGEDGLDARGLVGAQDLLEAVGGNALAPGRFDDLDVEAVALAHVDPAVREHAVARASTVSPGDSVLVIATSQPPVPVAGKMTDRGKL
jgi:hypothetical protein